MSSNKYSVLSVSKEETEEGQTVHNFNFGDLNLLSQKRNQIQDWKYQLAWLRRKIHSIIPPQVLKILPWFCLITATVCTATLAPAFKVMGQLGVRPFLRANWRSQIMGKFVEARTNFTQILLLAIPSYIEYKNLPDSRKKNIKKWSSLMLLLKVSFWWTASMAFWVMSLDYTTSARASIVANSTPLILVCWYKIKKFPISKTEISGTGVAFLGLLLTALGTLISSGATFEPIMFAGDMLNIGAAFSSACYLTYAGRTREIIPLFTFTISATFLMNIPLTILSVVIEGTQFTWDCRGLFAWVLPEFLKVAMFVSIVVGVVGINLNSYSMAYVPPLYISLVKLCDPFLSGMFSFLSGVDPFPTVWTFIGGFVTVLGIGVLSYGSHRRKQREALFQIVQVALSQTPPIEAGMEEQNYNNIKPLEGDEEPETSPSEPFLENLNLPQKQYDKLEESTPVKLEILFHNKSVIGQVLAEGIQNPDQIIDAIPPIVQDALLQTNSDNHRHYIPYLLPNAPVALISPSPDSSPASSPVLTKKNQIELDEIRQKSNQLEIEELPSEENERKELEKLNQV